MTTPLVGEAARAPRRTSRRWLRAVVVALASFEAGWMVFDGARALVVGDYVTPATGPYAGQLGPWAAVVSTLGIDPRAPMMKTFFVVYGMAWLLVAIAFLRGVRGSWWAMVFAATASLWYLVVGTIASAAQLALLILLRARSSAAAGPAGSAPLSAP